MIKDRENFSLAPGGVVGNMNIDCNLLVDQCPMLGFFMISWLCVSVDGSGQPKGSCSPLRPGRTWLLLVEGVLALRI